MQPALYWVMKSVAVLFFYLLTCLSLAADPISYDFNNWLNYQGKYFVTAKANYGCQGTGCEAPFGIEETDAVFTAKPTSDGVALSFSSAAFVRQQNVELANVFGQSIEVPRTLSAERAITPAKPLTQPQLTLISRVVYPRLVDEYHSTRALAIPTSAIGAKWQIKAEDFFKGVYNRKKSWLKGYGKLLDKKTIKAEELHQLVYEFDFLQVDQQAGAKTTITVRGKLYYSFYLSLKAGSPPFRRFMRGRLSVLEKKDGKKQTLRKVTLSRFLNRLQ